MTAADKLANSCIFCKIIRGEIPCRKVFESKRTLAFLDNGPLSTGHTLVIPKYHGEKLVDIPAEHLADILPVASEIARHLMPAVGATDYNILQNNGLLAHQQVGHVHFHLIPKPSSDPKQGLGVGWPAQPADPDQASQLLAKLNQTEVDWKAKLVAQLDGTEGSTTQLDGAEDDATKSAKSSRGTNPPQHTQQ